MRRTVASLSVVFGIVHGGILVGDDPTTSQNPTYSGRVFGPNGKPLKQVSVRLLPPQGFAGANQTKRATSDDDGRFRFSISKSELDSLVGPRRSESPRIVADAPGFGPDWKNVSPKGQTQLTFRLGKDDKPIRGRIVTLEGKPVAAATIRVKAVHCGPATSLSKFLESIKDGSHSGKFEQFKKHWNGPLPGQAESVTTDADGRFRIAGLGRDRLIQLVVSGKNIATGAATVMTRDSPPGETLQLNCVSCHPAMVYSDRVYDASFDLVAPPGLTIRGTVRDKETGDALPGVTLVERLSDNTTVSDANGQFEMSGFVKCDRYRLTTVPSRTHPWFTRAPGRHHVVHNVSRDLSPIETEIKCVRGFWKTVRAVGLDGQPLEGVTGVGLTKEGATGEYGLAGPLTFPHRVILTHEKQKLIAFLMMRGTEREPITVKLQPWGRIIGRIVDDKGNARNGTSRLLDVTFMPFASAVRTERRNDPTYGIFPPNTIPDTDSRFVFDRVVPGQKYTAGMAIKAGKILFEDIVVKPGETRDLGDVVLVPKVFEQ